MTLSALLSQSVGQAWRPGHEQGSLLMTASPSSTAMMRHGLDAAVQPGLRCCNMADSEGEVCECGGWGVGGGEWLGRVVGGGGCEWVDGRGCERE